MPDQETVPVNGLQRTTYPLQQFTVESINQNQPARTNPAKRPTMTTKPRTLLPLPDPPEREPEDMTSFQHLAKNGNLHHLVQYLGNPETTIVEGEKYIVREPGAPAAERLVPDLLIAMGAYPETYRQDNGYVVSRQGKPPDFIMEIASPGTRRRDTGEKRDRYASLGVTEYWRFDDNPARQGVRLAGDRLVDGQYEPIATQEVEDGVLQGYSAALGLLVRWEHGELRWHDPETGREIPTFEQEREGRLAEQSAKLAAEARVRQLEAELARRDKEE